MTKAANLLRSELRALNRMVATIRRRDLGGKTVAEVLAFYRATRRVAREDVRRQTKPQDFEPEDGVFAEGTCAHHRVISQALLSEHPHRKCQMLFLPSFAPEGVVYVVRPLQNGDGSVVVKELKHAYMFERLLSAAGQGRREVQRWEVTIKRTDAALLESLWVALLARVHYEEAPSLGLDGVHYHAAHFSDELGYRSGKVWSPRCGTLASDFIAVAEDLRQMPKEGDAGREAVRHSLIEKAEALLERALSTRS